MPTQPLLLLHGALGSQQQLAPLKEALAGDFEVHSLNFTGHGGRAWSEADFSMDLFAQDVLTYLDENSLTQTDILGYSMGGYVALYLALRKPQRVHRIWTIATKFAWSPETATREVKMLDPSTITAKVPAFAKALAARHAPQSWQQHLTKTATMMRNLGQGAALQTTHFAAIPHRVWLTVGTEDKMVSQEETQRVADALPNATFEALEGLPHPIEKMPVAALRQRAIAYFTAEKA